jgi:hypothetical protein
MRNVQSFYKAVLVMVTLFAISAFAVENISAQNFTRITSGALASDLGGFLGSAWGDYDNDGNVDLFVANCQSQSPNLLFHNEGNGSFTKITTGDIVTDRAASYSASWGDYDNDGDLDLFVTNIGTGNYLYRNDGNGFARIKEDAIVRDQGRSNSASWGDYDNDGDLDLFVANDSEKNFLYQNNGNGTFTKITSGIIVNDKVASSVVGLWADYDNDGDLDLYVVNGFFAMQENYLYRNEGHGNFTKITEGAIVTDVEGSTGGCWGDYDNDGFLDLYVTNSVNNAPNSLYRNNGNGTFAKVMSGSQVTDLGHSVGCSWVDYDNDGDLDLFVVNVFASKNNLYRNNGNGTFTKITTGAIVTDANWSFGCSWADYDNDGDQDVIVTNGGISQTLSNFVYRNDLNQSIWIAIQLEGTTVNSAAMGTIVRAKATIAGKPVWQMQQVTGQTSFYGQNSLDIEFGLGDADKIDSLVVQWPSGETEIFVDVAPNQKLAVKQAASYQKTFISGFTGPATTIRIFSNNIPTVVVKNLGDNNATTFSVGCRIDSAGNNIYSGVKSLATLKSKEAMEVAFDKWTPLAAGDYQVEFYLEHSDITLANDTMKTQIKVTELIDDFETGLGNWITNSGWKLINGISYKGNGSLSSAGGISYPNNANDWIVYADSFDFSQIKSAYIAFWTRHLIELNHDYGYVEMSTDGGQNWEQVGDGYTGIKSSWYKDGRSLSAYCGKGYRDVKLRFRFVSDSTRIGPALGWFIDNLEMKSGELVTSVAEDKSLEAPSGYRLSANYPNPFNPETNIEYELPKSGLVRLEVYNLLGQKIKTLIDQNQMAGVHQAIWNGKNEFDEAVASGIYLYRMETNDFKATKRMLLIR